MCLLAAAFNLEWRLNVKRSSDPAAVFIPPVSRKIMEQPEVPMCTYCPANPAFYPKRVLLRRLFFINENMIKYVSVGFCPARVYQSVVEFGVVQIGGVPKTNILSDEQV